MLFVITKEGCTHPFGSIGNKGYLNWCLHVVHTGKGVEKSRVGETHKVEPILVSSTEKGSDFKTKKTKVQFKIKNNLDKTLSNCVGHFKAGCNSHIKP